MKNLISLLFGSLLAFLPALSAPGIAAAEAPTHHRTVFDIRFGGLQVGSAQFDIRFDDKSYDLALSGKTAGAADVFVPGNGTAASKGTIDVSGIDALTHSAMYFEQRKKKRSTLDMQIDGGQVVKVAAVPLKKKTGPKWIQIEPSQLRDVIDPASAIVVPVDAAKAGDPAAVCNRTLNIYDGDTRYDMVLTYKATRPIKTKGYEGYAYVCRMRYVPVAGHKRGQKNVEYMARNKGMEIWLAPMQQSRVFSVIRVEVPTWIGTVSALPAYFGQVE